MISDLNDRIRLARCAEPRLTPEELAMAMIEGMTDDQIDEYCYELLVSRIWSLQKGRKKQKVSAPERIEGLRIDQAR